MKKTVHAQKQIAQDMESAANALDIIKTVSSGQSQLVLDELINKQIDLLNQGDILL